MNTLPSLISESEALRKVNLPSTPRWREFLRTKLPCQSAGGSTVYERQLVEELASRIADFAQETAPIETREPSPKRSTRSDGLTVR